MASAPEGTETLNYQTSVLKVSIHCEGCKKKVRKVLKRLDGVYSVDINSKENKVTVSSSIDANSLIRWLAKHGKHAELWPEKKPMAANSSGEAVGDANAKPKTEQQVPNTEQQQQTEESKTETTKATEISDSKANTDPPTSNESDKRDREEPVDLKEEEKPQRETSSEDRSAVSDADKSGNKATTAEIPPPPPPPPPKQIPSNAQPAYTVSYSAAQPSTSYAYYASSPPTENCSFDQYYGSMEEVSVGSYHIFNDENPNACNLM